MTIITLEIQSLSRSLIRRPHTIVVPNESSLPHTRLETLAVWRWAIRVLQKSLELEILLYWPVRAVQWHWRMGAIYQSCGSTWCLLRCSTKKDITRNSAAVHGSWPRHHCWLLKAICVVHYTWLASGCAIPNWMQLKMLLGRICGTKGRLIWVRKGCRLSNGSASFSLPKVHHLTLVSIVYSRSNIEFLFVLSPDEK